MPTPLNICYSGGALGADLAFGDAAKAAGQRVVHWHFEEKKRDKEDFHILSSVQLKMADPFLMYANKTLQRGSYPYSKEYTNNLLRRNYFQVVQSDSLYAVSRIKDGQVLGGTAWATQMFIDKNKGDGCSCFVFDMNSEHWHIWDGTAFYRNPQTILGKVFSPPKPTGKYAGVGSRELTDKGQQAIVDLYL